MIFAALGDICAEIEPDQLEGKVLPVEVQTIEIGFNGEVDSWGNFIKALVDDGYRNDYIVRLAGQQTKPTIILCSQVRHCEILTTLTAEAGLKPLLIHGQLPTKLRAERMAAAQNARLIIGTAQLLGEGLDIPHLQTLIFATPMSAVIEKEGDPAATKLIQSIGRCRHRTLEKLMPTLSTSWTSVALVSAPLTNAVIFITCKGSSGRHDLRR